MKQGIEGDIFYNELQSRLNTEQKEGYENMKKKKHIKQKAKICSYDIKTFGIIPQEFDSILRYKFDT